MAQKPISFISYVFSKKNLAVLAAFLLIAGYAIHGMVNAQGHYEYKVSLWVLIAAILGFVGNILYDAYQWNKEGLGRNG